MTDSMCHQNYKEKGLKLCFLDEQVTLVLEQMFEERITAESVMIETRLEVTLVEEDEHRLELPEKVMVPECLIVED